MAGASRTTVKGPNAFRTISEAAEAVGAPQHVLRFWETKFSFVSPVKRAGGRRFYRPQDVVLLKAIRRLLHDEGLTIKGVQRLHRDQGLARLAAYGDPEAGFAMNVAGAEASPQRGPDSPGGPGGVLDALLTELQTAKSRLDAALAQ